MSPGPDVRPDVGALLRAHPLLTGVEAAQVTALEARSRIEVLSAEAPCIREGDAPEAFWLLLSGSARVFFVSEEGLEVTVKIFCAPAAFGEIELLTGHPHAECVSMIDRGRVAIIPRSMFSALLDASARFSRNVLADTCARFLIAVQNERALAFLSVEQRLAHVLLSYARSFGVPVEGGLGLRVELSQARLALDMGVAVKSVQRTMTRWKREGLLATRGRSLVLRDLAALRGVVGADLLGLNWSARAPEVPGAPRRRA